MCRHVKNRFNKRLSWCFNIFYDVQSRTKKTAFYLKKFNEFLIKFRIKHKWPILLKTVLRKSAGFENPCGGESVFLCASSYYIRYRDLWPMFWGRTVLLLQKLGISQCTVPSKLVKPTWPVCYHVNPWCVVDGWFRVQQFWGCLIGLTVLNFARVFRPSFKYELWVEKKENVEVRRNLHTCYKLTKQAFVAWTFDFIYEVFLRLNLETKKLFLNPQFGSL